MKNNIKLYCVLFSALFITSCSNNDDLKYQPDVESGWVQFLETEDGGATLPDIGLFQGAEGLIELDVNIQVPTTSTDLTINYDLVSVSGTDPNSVFSNTGKTVAPAGRTSYAGPDNGTGFDYSYLANIGIDLSELSGTELSEPMVFDVVLTGTSSGMITAGLGGEFPVSQRIIINPSLEGFIGTFTVAEMFTAGPNSPSGLSDFFGESYQLELDRVVGDATGSRFVVSTTTGFDFYLVDGVVIVFDVNGTFSFEDGLPVDVDDDGVETIEEDGFAFVGGFRNFEYVTSMYDYENVVLQADGPLSTFGEYQFIFTKQ